MLVIAPAVAIPHPQLFVAKRLFSSVDQWRKRRKITECTALQVVPDPTRIGIVN